MIRECNNDNVTSSALSATFRNTCGQAVASRHRPAKFFYDLTRMCRQQRASKHKTGLQAFSPTEPLVHIKVIHRDPSVTLFQGVPKM